MVICKPATRVTVALWDCLLTECPEPHLTMDCGMPLGLPVWSVIDAILGYAYNILWPHLMGPRYIIIYCTLARHQSNGVWHKNKLETTMRILILNGSSRCVSSKMRRL